MEDSLKTNLNKLFYLIVVVSIYFDLDNKETSECISKDGKLSVLLVLIFHHIIVCFGKYGFLLSNRILLYIYVIVPFCMFTYWGLNDDKCHITTWTNEECGWKEERKFNDLFNIAGLKEKKLGNSSYFIFCTLGVCIALYRIHYRI